MMMEMGGKEDMGKKIKSTKQIDIIKSVRHTWGELNPVTRVVPNKKKYNRAKEKRTRKNNTDE
jgi:hypothetical protein